MPRRPPTKNITLLLPPPTSRPGPSQAGPSTLPEPSPSVALDALLLARKMAKADGKSFDMESFMTPEIKKEWYARTHRRRPRSSASAEPIDNASPSKRARTEDVTTSDQLLTTNPTLPEPTPTTVPPTADVVMAEGDPPPSQQPLDVVATQNNPPAETIPPSTDNETSIDHAPNGEAPSNVPPTTSEPPEAPITIEPTTAPSDADDTLPVPPATEESSTTAPPTEAEAEAPPVPAIPKRVRPTLLHMHWKRREKLLAQWDAENALIEAGVVIDPAHSVETILKSFPDAFPPAETGGGNRRELTEKEKVGITESASYWNSLLISARKSRGPQWDFNTQQHHVDLHSHAYYSHMDKPLRSELPKVEPMETQTSNRAPMSREGPFPSTIGPAANATPGPSLPNGSTPNPFTPQSHQPNVPSSQNTTANGMPIPRTAMPSPHPIPPQIMQNPQQGQSQLGSSGNLGPAQMQALIAMQAQAQGRGSGSAPSIPGMGGINPAMILAAQQRANANNPNLQFQSGGSMSNPTSGINIAAMMAAHQSNPGQGQTGNQNHNAALQAAMQGLSNPSGGGNMQGLRNMQNIQGMQGINLAQLQASIQQQQQQQQQQQPSQFSGMNNAGQDSNPGNQWMRNGMNGQGPMLTGNEWGQK